MKHLILTIGSQGSGKSTWTQDYVQQNPKFVRISQDEHGKDGHLIKYKNALLEGSNIIVDRMNYNYEQRMKYVKPALDAGYTVHYKHFYVPYNEAMSRIMNREGHPSIPKGNYQICRTALDFYWKNAEVPFHSWQREGASEFKTNDWKSPKVWHISPKKDQRVLIFTDIHSCYQELCQLLANVNYRPSSDVLIINGDLFDRGPDSHKVLDFYLKFKPIVIMGNHDQKFVRWLKANKVQVSSLTNTLAQLQGAGFVCSDDQKRELYEDMMSFPYIVKVWDDNYITHAGFNPTRHPEDNGREFCMYARHYDIEKNTFANPLFEETNNQFWWDFPRKYPDYNLFVGHNVVPECKVVGQDNAVGRIYRLDAGACFGIKLRCAILEYGKEPQMIEIQSSMPPKAMPKPLAELTYSKRFEKYEAEVEKGYLSKKVQGKLILYNYTEKCTFEKKWDEITLNCRGVIYNAETKECAARPFGKFFNLGELEGRPDLGIIPVGESYRVEDKLDGSMGTLYKDPEDKLYKIATRGSFESEQAKIGTEILQALFAKLTQDQRSAFKAIEEVATPVFEIIYPENRFNDGARLVCDYGTARKLVLLAVIDKKTGKEWYEFSTDEMAELLGCEKRKVYNLTLEELSAMKKTLPVTQEGWVVVFQNGLRVKVKGDEYCKMQKILNSISPLSIWEKMMDEPNFELSAEYLALIPEEISPEVIALQDKLLAKYKQKCIEFMDLYFKAIDFAFDNYPTNHKKGLGLYKQQHTASELASGFFLQYDKRTDELMQMLWKTIRPTGNEL